MDIARPFRSSVARIRQSQGGETPSWGRLVDRGLAGTLSVEGHLLKIATRTGPVAKRAADMIVRIPNKSVQLSYS